MSSERKPVPQPPEAAEASLGGPPEAETREELLQVLEPATGEVLSVLRQDDAETIDMAVERALRAFHQWREVSPKDRGRLLLRMAQALEQRRAELIELEMRDIGKPRAQAEAEFGIVLDTFRYYAGAPERPMGDTIEVEGGLALTYRQPYGVAGLIVPWNGPLVTTAWKLAPALAAGNAAVIKPSGLAPLSVQRLEALALEAGFPEGLVNVVIGEGSVAGRQLVAHPSVSRIAFTGSTTTGRTIAAAAADGIKKVSLELGGKSANIVFADADLEAAACAAPMAVFAIAGQDCCARSRILVERSVKDEFVELLRVQIEGLRVGDPMEQDDVDLGPLISAEARKRVSSYAADVEVVATGSAPDGPGFWFPPMIVEPEPGSRHLREEIFGPIASIVSFDDEAEAIAMANDTEYGLSGSVWTRDIGRALRTVNAIETGAISVNSNNSVRVTTPFAGTKHSGLGEELGPRALEEYSRIKSVFIAHGTDG